MLPAVVWREETEELTYKDCSSTSHWESSGTPQFKSFVQSLTKTSEPDTCKCGDEYCSAEEDCLETKEFYGGPTVYKCSRRIMPDHLTTYQSGHQKILAPIPQFDIDFWKQLVPAEDEVCRCGPGYADFCNPGQTCFVEGNNAVCGEFFGPDNADVFTTECAAGEYNDDALNVNAQCKTCPAGFFSEASSSLCTECAAGKYSDILGATSASACKSCPQGYYSNKCETVEEGLFLAIKNIEFANGYKSLGDGSCKNFRALPEGELPDLLSGDHPLYDANKIKECKNRCLNAYPDSFTFFVKSSDDNKCAGCGIGNCERIASPSRRSKAARINFRAWNPRPLPLGKCEGDCDRDSDCEGDMVCMQIGYWPRVVPDCIGSLRPYGLLLFAREIQE